MVFFFEELVSLAVETMINRSLDSPEEKPWDA